MLYLGMEEYSELGGTKLRYESEDLGQSWSLYGCGISEVKCTERALQSKGTARGDR